MMDLTKAAVYYAMHGLYTFPAYAGKKEPAGTVVPRGCYDATSIVDKIRRWWAINPAFNPCITTGLYEEFGFLFVIDIDPAGDAWLDTHGPTFPPTWASRTGKGGMHLYFWSSVPVPCSVGTVAPGVDVRGGDAVGKGRGYVLAPGSVHPNHCQYRTIHGNADTIAWTSQALLDLLLPRPKPVSVIPPVQPATSRAEYPTVEVLISWAMDRARQCGSRNVGGKELALNLLAHDYDGSVGWSAMLAYQSRVAGWKQPAYTENEAAKTWNKCQQYPRIPPWKPRENQVSR